MTSSLPRGWRRRIFWSLTAATLIQIAGFGGVYSWVWGPVAIFFSAILSLFWISALRKGITIPWHVLLWPCAIFGALVLAQWCFGWTAYRGETLTELLQLSACGSALYLALVAFDSQKNVERLGYVLWGFTGALAVEAIFQNFTAAKQIYWYHDASYATPVGPYVYHNHYAGILDLLLPVAVVVTFRPVPRGQSPWSTWMRRGLIPALAFGSLILSQSRGGLLAIGAEFLIVLPLLWKTPRYRTISIAAVLVALGFGFLVNFHPLITRILGAATDTASVQDRWRVTRDCWRIFRAHPWMGTGFGTFAAVFPAYQTVSTTQQWLAAHNEYAQTIAETGFAGAACVVAFLVIFIKNGWELCMRLTARHTPSSLATAIRFAAWLGASGFLIHSWGDFEFHAPANATLFFVLAAVACTRGQREKATPGNRSSSTRAAAQEAPAAAVSSESSLEAL